MAARAALYELLRDDSELETLGVQEVYPTNAVDTPAEECFLVIRWEPSTVAFKTTGTDRVSIWVHDKQRDYGRIDDVLSHLRQLLTSVVHQRGSDGSTITVAEWLGEGPDLYDGGYETCTRYGEFSIVSR